MWRTEDGRVIDMVLSPLSVISRVNISQLYEIDLGLISRKLYELLDKYYSRSEELPADVEETCNKAVALVLPSNTKSLRLLWQSAKDNDTDYIQIVADSIDRYFTSAILTEAKEVLGVKSYVKVFDPMSGKWIRNPVHIGYQEFLRLHFIATDKLRATGGLFSNRVNEDLVMGYGKRRKLGQSLGEQENMALLAHGVPDILKEFSKEDESKGIKLEQTLLVSGLILSDD